MMKILKLIYFIEKIANSAVYWQKKFDFNWWNIKNQRKFDRESCVL